MALRRTVLQELLLGALILAALEAKQINSSCNRRCGSLSIPYPFGTSEDCYLDPHFLITCNHTFNPPKPFPGDGNVEVLHISLDGELLVDNYVAGSCVNGSSNNPDFTSGWTRISYKKNKFITVGCDTVAFIEGNTTKKNYTTGCISRCDSINSVVNGSCNGIGCCESLIPEDITYFNISVIRLYNDSKTESFNPCGFGFLVEKGAYKFSSLDLANLQNRETLPVVLDWAVGDETCSEAQKNKTSYACKATYSECYNSTNGPGYRCRCSSGYEGNPYLPNGCKDVDECKASNPCSSEKQCINVYGTFKCVCQKGYKEYKVKNETMCSPKDNNYGSIAIGLGIAIGFSLLLIGSFSIYWGLKKRKFIKLKEKYFQENGGLMLQQQLSNYSGSEEPTKIFNAEELKKATNNYDKSMILGQGGNGIVYKGVLPGNRLVAIKKSKVFDQSQVKQFVNEVVLLTQINHRNVVKLLGCCFETEVPLLVYEFITNGTLFKHIHNKNCSSSLSWEQRLNIAIETAGVLAYLHSEISMPIIHRDVKSANILLDDNMTAKVADFGASRLVSLDKTKVTTLVQGTYGYLDPEYFYTSQLTEKSDVYSFGVVLAELLTSMEVIFSDSTGIYTNLAMYFVLSMKEDHLFDILDNHIMNEDNVEELQKVANLVQRCLSVRGEDRPSMREVAMELEGLRIVKTHAQGNTTLSMKKTESSLTEPAESISTDVGADCSFTNESMTYDTTRSHELKAFDDGR